MSREVIIPELNIKYFDELALSLVLELETLDKYPCPYLRFSVSINHLAQCIMPVVATRTLNGEVIFVLETLRECIIAMHRRHSSKSDG